MRNNAGWLTLRLSTTLKHDTNQSPLRKLEPNNKELPKLENSDSIEIYPSSCIIREHYTPAQDIPPQAELFCKILCGSYRVTNVANTLTLTTHFHSTAERKQI